MAPMRFLSLTVFIPLASAVYQLEFLGDYQTGAYDTDAAENVAFDPISKKAFVASAASSKLQVIDISNPQFMTRTGTIDVKGAMVAGACTDANCFYSSFDFGGGSAPCGYAPMKNIWFEKGDCSACADSGSCSSSDCVYSSNPSYNAGSLQVDAIVGTYEGCQQKCQQDDTCEYFSWEKEIWTSGNSTLYGPVDPEAKAIRVGRCFLKGAYGSTDRQGNSVTGTDCGGGAFVHWEAHKSERHAEECSGITSNVTCINTIGAQWDSGECTSSSGFTLAMSQACEAAGGTVTHKYTWGFYPGAHYNHISDPFWQGGSGPKNCKAFEAESVQSVAVTHVPGYPNSVVIAAAPHKLSWAKGMLAFFDAETMDYLTCAPAGNKPEGITSMGTGKVACINEGSAMDVEDTPLDVEGSMTICDITASATMLTPACVTKEIAKSNFQTGKWKHAVEYRLDELRLYGPNGNNITYDVEPEGGAFTEDGKYLLVNLQDNDGYAMYDVTAGKYIFMAGWASSTDTVTIDGSDKDDQIKIHAITGATKMRMPDQITSFSSGGKYYFVTANEGGSRDGGDGLLGEVKDADGEDWFNGEEIDRLKMVQCAGDTSLCENDQVGRILTTAFAPSDYAMNACGNQLCDAKGLASGQDTSSSPQTKGVKGPGEFKCIYKNADYGGCGSACNLDGNDDPAHEQWHYSPGSCSNYPATLAHYVDSAADNAYMGASCTANNCDTDGWSYASWAADSGVKAELREVHSADYPLGYKAAEQCQLLCDANADCKYFYMEYEMGKFECFLKAAYADGAAHCHEFDYKDDRYQYSINYVDGTSGVKPYVSEGYANWGGPRTSDCKRDADSKKAVYTTTKFSAMVAPGVHGGVATVGGRSVSIYEWDGTAEKLTLVFDSGTDMEDKQSMVKGDLCKGCEVAATGDKNMNDAGQECKKYCPFNSDEAPPKLDDRSDAKGPEPECVTTGLMPDGTRLVFVGMERTGGIQVYDATDPSAPVFQDFLNVRNWLTSSADMTKAEAVEDLATNYSNFMIQKALNDGPESLVFFNDGSISADPVLLAVTPLAGRLTAYKIVKSDAVRADDGSCPQTADCPYISTLYGGSGTALANVQVSLEFTAQGDVSDFDEAKKTQILNAFSKSLGLGDTAPAGSSVTVTPASVKIACTFIASDPSVADNAKNQAALLFGSAAQLNSFFSSKGITGVVAETGATLVATVIPDEAEATVTTTQITTEGDDNSLVIGLAVGGALGAVLLCVVIFMCCMIKREKAGKPIFTNLEPRKGATA